MKVLCSLVGLMFFCSCAIFGPSIEEMFEIQKDSTKSTGMVLKEYAQGEEYFVIKKDEFNGREYIAKFRIFKKVEWIGGTEKKGAYSTPTFAQWQDTKECFKGADFNTSIDCSIAKKNDPEAYSFFTK